MNRNIIVKKVDNACGKNTCANCPHYKNCNTDKPFCDYSNEELSQALNDFNINEEIGIEPVNPIKPSYYNDSKITPFNVIDDWSLDFYLGNAIKYIKRAGKKDNNSRLQDLKKVSEYIAEEIKREEVKHD